MLEACSQKNLLTMGYWLVVQGNLNLFEVAVFHGVDEQQTWQRPVGGASDRG
jgi:hypothetical protein